MREAGAHLHQDNKNIYALRAASRGETRCCIERITIACKLSSVRTVALFPGCPLAQTGLGPRRCETDVTLPPCGTRSQKSEANSVREERSCRDYTMGVRMRRGGRAKVTLDQAEIIHACVGSAGRDWYQTTPERRSRLPGPDGERGSLC